MSTYSSSVSSRNSQAVLNREPAKSYYQDDQQAKFVHLQAEIDTLLQQLQKLKQQKSTTTDVEE